MKALSAGEKEARRLAALRRYAIVDTLPEMAFDELTRLAAQICATPISLISLIDAERQWFKSRVGLELQEIPRSSSICTHAIAQSALLVVEDLSQDPRFATSPVVRDGPKARFYAGIPLSTPDGFNLGTLCVMDGRPRRLTEEQAIALEILGRQAASQLELRRHLIELGRSVEQHKVIEERLRNSEAFYQTLVDTLPQNIFRKDTEGRFTFANKKFCHSLGRPLNEVLGKSDFDFFPPELARKYKRDDERVMSMLENLDTIEAHVTHDGSKLYVHVIKTALYDSMGQVVGIQGIFWDVTQARNNEQALAYERDLLRGLLDNIPDRIYFKDVHSRFLRCSTSMARRLGLQKADEIIGKTDFDFHPVEHADEFFADEQRIILTGLPLVNKLERQLDTSGQEIWASVTKVPIYNQNGQVTGIIGISRDVTELKQAERALQQAAGAALETARIKSQFLANMSHEIRTPMNAIVGMTGLLMDTKLNQEQREFVETVRDSTHTLLGIISGILDFSKLEAGKFTLETIDFDLRDAVENTVEMLAENAQHKRLELACWVEHDVPNLLRGDPGRLRQVLANLLTNAIKFTDKGEVTLRLSKLTETDKDVILKFGVTDTGIGITPEAIARIFNPFTQADGSTTRRFGGTGLGLSICKQLVELMDGEIGVESAVGQGSTFWFKLPLEKQPQAIVQETDLAPVLSERLKNVRILIADEAETQRLLIAHQLERLKLPTVRAVLPGEVIETLRAATRAHEAYDVLILDLDPTQLDPLCLVENIKSDCAITPLRLLALTAIGHRLNPVRMQELGVAGCIVKPVRQARLFECLSEVMSGSGIAAGASPTKETQWFFASVPAANVRVLLAEDNLVNQRLALRQLRKLGYNADAVANGSEVWHALQQIPYDIILLDCQMPEVDGYEVARRIRDSEKRLDNPLKAAPYIIALTANALYGDRERCLAAGMNDYLTKPLRLEDLELSLQRAVARINPASRQSKDTASCVDPVIIAGLRELRQPGDTDPLHELVDLFFRDARPRLQKMEQAVAEKDSKSLAAAAHGLKGSASNLGARRLAALCANLEKMAGSNELGGAANILLDIKGEFQLVEEALAAELQK